MTGASTVVPHQPIAAPPAGPVASESALFIREAHHIVRDLLAPDARHYWLDFIATMLVIYTTWAVYITATNALVVAFALVACALALYRAAIFTHEIAHRRSGGFASFAVAWNVLYGVPFLMPSFMYGDHHRHHANQAYGTWADPEYLMRGPRWRVRLMAFVLMPPIYPLLACVRFLLLTPLALLSSKADRVVWTFASSLYVMNESYRRDFDEAARTRSRWLLEIACACWAWTAILLAVFGMIPWSILAKTYVVFVVWIALNQLRTLAAHSYGNESQASIGYLEQLLDSNTFPRGGWLPDLWAPLGLRYHALHHLLPALPYHAMGEAHQRLMTRLPADSPYHRTIRRGLWPAVRAVVRSRLRQ